MPQKEVKNEPEQINEESEDSKDSEMNTYEVTKILSPILVTEALNLKESFCLPVNTLPYLGKNRKLCSHSISGDLLVFGSE